MCALAAVQVIMVALYTTAQPVWRGFFCDDETIRYRYKSDTVTLSMLLITVFVVIPITVSIATVLYDINNANSKTQ